MGLRDRVTEGDVAIRAQPRRAPARRTVRPRSAVPLLVALLAGVSAVALLGVAWALPSSDRAVASFAADVNKAAVLHFYAAADDLLRTEGAGPLADAVAPGVVAHDPASGAAVDRDGLEHRLRRLLDVYRAPRLTVLDVVADAEWATARVELRAEGRRDAAGLRLTGSPPPKQATERFRLSEGEIVEHWPGQLVPDRAVDLPATVVTPAPADVVGVLTRFAFAPGAALPAVVGGPELIAVQAGALAVEGGRAALLHRQGAGEPSWIRASPDGGTARLGPGDLLLVPTGVRRQMRNEGTAPVVAIGVGAYPRTALYGSQNPANWNLSLFASRYDPGLLRFPTEHAPGVVGEVLAIASCSPAAGRPVALTGGRVVLAPAEGIAPHAVADSELLAVEAGMLGIDAAGSMATARVVEPAPNPSRGLAAAGDAVVRHSGDAVGLTNLGGGEATILVVGCGPAAGWEMSSGDP